MSRTNLDLLFQVTTSVAERTCFNMPRVDELGPGFDDHLSQASSTTLGGTSTTSRTNDRPPDDGLSSNDHHSSSTDQNSSSMEATPREMAATTESAVTAETPAAIETSNGGPEDADSDESGVVEERGATQTMHPHGDPAPIPNEADDTERESDEENPQSEVSIVAVAEHVNTITTVITARAESSAPTESEEAFRKTNPPVATVKIVQSANRVATERISVDSMSADASTENSSVEMTQAINAPMSPSESNGETAVSKPDRKFRAAKPRSADTEQQAHRGEQTENRTSSNEQIGDAALPVDTAQAKTESASVEPMFSESGQSEHKAGTDENREANARSSARQRSDAVALANKISTAAVANGAATQPTINAPPRETDAGATRAGKTAGKKVDGVGNAATRLHANAGSSKRGGKVNGADEMPRIDPARFVGRVAKAFHTAQERGGTLQIRLSPPELGAMRLELTVKDGVMAATLETETASARRVLLEHLPALRDRLAEQNIRVERFDVDVRREGGNGQTDPRATQDQQQSQQGQADQRRRPASQPPIAETARPTKPIGVERTSNNGINLVA
jgi:flagellar hook-length control protein FliK